MEALTVDLSWFRLRNRHVTVLLLCFVSGRCEFLYVIHGVYESNTKQKSALVINKTIWRSYNQTLPKSTLQKYFIATALTASTA